MDDSALLEILDRLRKHPAEKDVVEFKSNLTDPTQIGEYISALTNAAALAGAQRAWLV